MGCRPNAERPAPTLTQGTIAVGGISHDPTPVESGEGGNILREDLLKARSFLQEDMVSQGSP